MVEKPVGPSRDLHLAPATGRFNGVKINARDGAAIKDVRRLTITAIKDTEFALIEATKARGALS